SKTCHVFPGTDVPNVHSDGVVGKGKSGPPVLSNPSNGNPWEKDVKERIKNKSDKVIFFMQLVFLIINIIVSLIYNPNLTKFMKKLS
ncbi:MAG: hypothetical protein ACI9XR_001221, partial [Flavobacterium sp.]